MSQGSHAGMPDWGRIFPLGELSRAFWIAADSKKIALMMIALLLISGGFWALDQVFWQAPPAVINPPFWPWDSLKAESNPHDWPWQRPLRTYSGPNAQYEHPFEWSKVTGNQALQSLAYACSNWSVCLHPVHDLTSPAGALFDTKSSWSAYGRGFARCLWALCVWSLFGGAVGRMAAVQFARGESLSPWSGLGFSLGNLGNYLYAPLVPLGGVLVLWLGCFIVGILSRVAGAGDILLGVGWGLSLVLAFLMLLILTGVIVGWPLMIATINAEGTDGFDGLSRAFSYVYERPVQCLGYLAVALTIGSVGMYIAWMVAELVVDLAAYSMAAGMPDAEATRLLEWTGVARGRAVLPGAALESSSLSQRLVSLWLSGAVVAVHGFAASYFWSAVHVIYFLLRQSVDGKPLDEVYIVAQKVRDRLADLIGKPPQPVSDVAPLVQIDMSKPRSTEASDDGSGSVS